MKSPAIKLPLKDEFTIPTPTITTPRMVTVIIIRAVVGFSILYLTLIKRRDITPELTRAERAAFDLTFRAQR
jgi:hypothetical protein